MISRSGSPAACASIVWILRQVILSRGYAPNPTRLRPGSDFYLRPESLFDSASVREVGGGDVLYGEPQRLEDRDLAWS